MEEQESISEFAVPIGAAMKVLLSSNQNLYHVNLLRRASAKGNGSSSLPGTATC